jgi:hypothetical protein
VLSSRFLVWSSFITVLRTQCSRLSTLQCERTTSPRRSDDDAALSGKEASARNCAYPGLPAARGRVHLGLAFERWPVAVLFPARLPSPFSREVCPVRLRPKSAGSLFRPPARGLGS